MRHHVTLLLGLLLALIIAGCTPAAKPAPSDSGVLPAGRVGSVPAPRSNLDTAVNARPVAPVQAPAQAPAQAAAPGGGCVQRPGAGCWFQQGRLCRVPHHPGRRRRRRHDRAGPLYHGRDCGRCARGQRLHRLGHRRGGLHPRGDRRAGCVPVRRLPGWRMPCGPDAGHACRRAQRRRAGGDGGLPGGPAGQRAKRLPKWLCR